MELILAIFCGMFLIDFIVIIVVARRDRVRVTPDDWENGPNNSVW